MDSDTATESNLSLRSRSFLKSKKIQVKESQQSRNQWWIWSRDAVKGLPSSYLLLHQKARGKPDTKVKILWVCKLSSIIERRDTLYAHTHQATQNGILKRLGLLESGNLMNWWTIERGDPLWAHSKRTDSQLKTVRQILTPKQNQNCR